MTKLKRVSFLFLAILIVLFDQVFQIFNYGFLKPYLDKICPDPNFAATFASTVELIIFASIFFFVMKKKGSFLEEFNKDYKTASLKPYEIFLCALGFYGLTEIWLYVVEKFLIAIPAIKSSFDYFNKAMDLGASGDSSLILGLIYGTVLAALMEELLFRGIIHNCIKLSFKSRIIAILTAGILFGIWHGILVQGVYAAIGGIAFSYIYERTGKISVTIAIHFINNLISSTIPEINKFLPGIDRIYEIVTLIAVPVLIYYLFKIRPQKSTENNPPSPQSS